MATLLFYVNIFILLTNHKFMLFLTYQMSDVELGGATAFPKLGLRVPPSKVSG